MDDKEYNHLVSALLAEGMAPAAAQRIADEIADHNDDIVEELTLAGHPPQEADTLARQRLGDVSRLSQVICDGVRRRSFAGRHPVFAFIVLPVLLLAAFLVLPLPAGWLAGPLLPPSVKHDIHLLRSMTDMATLFFNTCATTAVCLCFLVMCRKSMCAFKWAAVSCLLLSAIGLLLVAHISIAPALYPGKRFTLTYTLELLAGRWGTMENQIGSLLPLLTMAAFYVRHRLLVKAGIRMKTA